METPSEQLWRRMESLFHAALDRPPEDRPSFLDSETSGDPELRRHVEEMLAHADDGARLAGSIAALAQSAVQWGGSTGRPNYVGSYRLVRELGRGGMGIVFEAVRDRADYRQTVALKLLPAWRDLPGLRERFRNERRILAGLDHPNIARFLDGGAEDGIPYFAMEYVDGIPLAEWRRQNPALRQTLDLFRQVCLAVHYAHENLVVHRDLKPANILVNRAGVPKLLDFGIAKLLSPSPGDHDTTTGLRQWTPDYASPEQVRGGFITIRTDVYSLGLILYELLCGERGQTADTTSALALDRSVCETDPPAPSVRALARGDAPLARQLRGDLDTIVSKAISKDPQRRYSSAAALNVDIECYLEGRPVSARPATLAYRIGKLVRRRRLAFAAAALVAATGAAGIVATIHQEHRVEQRFQQVRALATALVFDVHDRIQYLPGATDARKAIVATGLRYLESLRQDAASDPSLAIELAQAYLRIGDVQGNPLSSSLRDTDGAVASYAAARRLVEPLYKKHDPAADLPLAQVEYKLGLIQYLRGDGNGSDASLDHAQTIVWRVIGRSPRNPEALTLAGDISAQRALSATNRQDPAAARRAAEFAVDIAHRLVALQPGSTRSLDYLATAQSSLGGAYRAAGQIEESVRSYRESAATREQLVSADPQNSGYRRILMIGYGHLGDALGSPRSMGLGDLEGASQAYARAVAIAQTMVRADPADRTARSDLANAQYRAGDILLLQPRPKEALAMLEESERRFRELLKQDPANETWRYVMMYVQRRGGEAMEALGRYSDAALKLTASQALARSFTGSKDEIGARRCSLLATIDLARIEARAGSPSALALANRAVSQIASLNPVAGTRWSEATIYADLGRVYLQIGQNDQAVLWLRKSASVWRKMKVPAALERERAAESAAVQSTLSKLGI